MADFPTRIAPVNVETVEGEIKEAVENQRRMWGKPLLPSLLYARRPAIFKSVTTMWATIHGLKKLDGTLKALVNRRVAWWNGCLF